MKLLEWLSQADRRIMLGAAGGVLLLILLIGLVYVPVCGGIGRRFFTLRDLQRRISEARIMVKELPQREAASRASEERYRTMADRVGRGQSIARILESLSAQAKAHHLEYGAIQPPADASDHQTFTLGSLLTVREVPLTLQLSGRYRQLGEFLAELPGAPYVASLKRVMITRPHSESLKLHADLVLAVYLAEEGPGR